MFRLILMTFGQEDIKYYVPKFIQDNLRNSIIINSRKNRFLQQFQKTKLIN